MITFSYVSKTLFPSTAAIFVDRNRNYSSPTIIKTGLTSINMLQDTLERWGDYTGIQRKYNELGIFWLNGSFGTNSNNNTWIGKIKSMDPRLGIDTKTNNISGTMVYPNPVKQFAEVEFDLKSSTWLTFDITDMQGKLVSHLLRDKAKAGINRFSISTNDLENGIYFIQISQDDKVLISKKILVAH
jgi:Secretion system C-terminal sorting domain